MDLITGLVDAGRPVSLARYPQPVHGLIVGNWNVAVEDGEAGYFTSDGTFHPI